MKKKVALFMTVLLVSFASTDAGIKGLGMKKGEEENDPVVIKKSRAITYAKKGAKTGAMTGAGVGAMAGDEKTAAAGAAAGALAGAVAGYIYGDVKDRQLKSRDEAVAHYEYTPDKGVFVVIETVEADPTALTRGGKIQFKTVYTVLMPSEKESIEVNMGFGVVLAELTEASDQFQPGRLEVFKVKSGGGTFEVSVPLSDTSSYEPHSYKYVVGVQAGDSYAQEELIFNIRS
jgi:outer membrane lipoprotein SlyB